MVLLLCTYCLKAQTYGSIQGRVLDSLTQAPLDGGQVMVLKKGTTDAPQTVLTDSLGQFLLKQVPFGSYQVQISMVGYGTLKFPVELSAQRPDATSLKLFLSTQAKQLQETEILSEKPVIRNVAGKIIFDVGKTISDGAETAQESLQKIPGVNVGQDGAVTVRGKGNVKILVDGKPSPMAQTNPEQFLKSIPAKNIESIEVNTAPSAKYDAAGSGIVINIKLKKGRLEGFNGSLSAGVGTVFNKFNGSGNFNYKKGKVNVFANAYYRNEKTSSISTDNRRVMVGDSAFYFNQRLLGNNHSQSPSGKAGIEYSVDKNHTLTYTLDGNYWEWASKKSGTGDNRNGANAVLNNTQMGGQGASTGLNVTNAINYRQTFDTTDRALTIDVAHTYDEHGNHNESYSHTFDSLGLEVPASFFSKNTKNNGITHNILLQSDFNTPLKWEGSKIETGVKEEVNIFTSTTNVFDMATGTAIRDTVQSNSFNYTESVTAAYGTYSGKYKSFSFSGGLRWEHTYVTSPTSSVRQNYSSFFPDVTLGYNITENHILTLSYGRNINRPGFWMLNNSTTYNTPYSIWRGNPNIKPVFSNSVNLDYNATIKNQSFNISGSFSHNGGTFQQISSVDSNRVTTTQFQNAGTQITAYAGIDGTFKIFKWWDISASVSYDYSWYDYYYNGVKMKAQGGQVNFWGSTTFRFWKNASLQLWGWGNTGYVEAQSHMKPVGSVTVTLKKKFFKDRFIVAISCRDVFNTMKWTTHSMAPGLDSYTTWNSETRVGYLTLTYQFGNQTFSPGSKTKGKSNRLGGGGGSGGGGGGM